MTRRLAATSLWLCVLALSLGVTAFSQTPAPAAPATPAGQAQPAQPSRGGGRGGGRGNPTPPCGAAVTGRNMAPTSRCFEMRTYTVRPEGPGDINLLHARFRDATVRLFVKHGMEIVGFWQPVATPDTLIYILAYKDNAARDAQWAAFNADPEWVETRTRMNVGVGVVSVFMNAADYSPIK
jgi:hypothetical protein